MQGTFFEGHNRERALIGVDGGNKKTARVGVPFLLALVDPESA
jgi:hypothetical protein